MKVPYVVNEKTIGLFLDGRMHNIDKGDVRYNELYEALLGGEDYYVISEILNRKINTIRKAANGKITVDVDAGVVEYDGEEVRGFLVDRLLDLVEAGFDTTPWENFLANLMENPSYRSREVLYGFLESFNTPITEDGCFIAFKRIRDDWTDIHTGTIDNSVGAVVEMDRAEVDDDNDRTCSSGLHACASHYLDHFGSWGGSQRVVAVKINPRDVVSIPKDYNNSKMRVCRYQVVEELVDTSAVHEVENKRVYI